MNAKTAREIAKLDKAIEAERRNKLAWRKAVRNSEVAVMSSPPGTLSWFRDEDDWGGDWWFRPGYSSGAELARDRYMRKMHDIYLAWDKLESYDIYPGWAS